MGDDRSHRLTNPSKLTAWAIPGMVREPGWPSSRSLQGPVSWLAPVLALQTPS